MPTYRYECDSCEQIHEEFHSMTEDPRTKCPSCGGKLTRLIGGGGGVLLKGSGFYNTDNRSESYRSAAKKDESPSKSGSKSEGKKSKSDKKDSGGGKGKSSNASKK